VRGGGGIWQVVGPGLQPRRCGSAQRPAVRRGHCRGEGWWWSRIGRVSGECVAGIGSGMAQRSAVRTGSRRGAFVGGVGTEARAGAGESLRLTSDSQPANRASCNKIPRRRACLRPAPAIPNGLPSGGVIVGERVGGGRGLGWLAVNALRASGAGWPNGPPSAPARAGGLLWEGSAGQAGTDRASR
jgi:hypothetical protein